MTSSTPNSRTRKEFFDGLELAEPGLFPISDRRPESGDRAAPAYGGVAREPR